MSEWFAELSTLQRVFAFFAAVGGLLFLIRMVLTFAGIGDHDSGDLEVDAHGDAGVHGDADHGGDSDLAFRVLSFQGLTAFSMMFGLVGLALSRSSGAGAPISLGGGAAAGLGSVWVIDRMFRLFGRLQHSGTIDMRNAVGQEGTVYLTIPAAGTGKVRLTVQGRLRVVDAITRDDVEIRTDSKIMVIDTDKDDVLIVTRA